MPQTIARIYRSQEAATAAANELRDNGFRADAMCVVARPAAAAPATEPPAEPLPDSTGPVVASLTQAGIPPAHARIYAEHIQRGEVLVGVIPPFGRARAASAILEGHDPVPVDLPPEAVTMPGTAAAGAGGTAYGSDAAPLSSALGWRTLLSDPAPLSNWLGWPTLKQDPPTSKTLDGIRQQRNDPAPLSGKLGMTVLSDNPAPLSSKFGWRLLSENQSAKSRLLNDPAPLSSKLGWRTLLNDPAPLSNRLGWRTLLNDPTPLSSRFGWKVLSNR